MYFVTFGIKTYQMKRILLAIIALMPAMVMAQKFEFGVNGGIAPIIGKSIQENQYERANEIRRDLGVFEVNAAAIFSKIRVSAAFQKSQQYDNMSAYTLFIGYCKEYKTQYHYIGIKGGLATFENNFYRYSDKTPTANIIMLNFGHCHKIFGNFYANLDMGLEYFSSVLKPIQGAGRNRIEKVFYFPVTLGIHYKF